MTAWLTLWSAAGLFMAGMALGIITTLWLLEGSPFPALHLRLQRHRLRYLRWPLNWLRLLCARLKPVMSKEPHEKI